MKYGFGVDVGGTTVKLACFDETGRLLDKYRIPALKGNNGKSLFMDISALISAYIRQKQLCKADILGIGIGIPGPVLPDGRVSTCVNLDLRQVNAVKILSQLTGLPVKALNDASAAALGECAYGGGKGCRDMLFVTLGTGVGGGIVANGQIISGMHGAGGEIGHITVNREESKVCSCGRKGCAEQYCSAPGIVHLMEDALRRERSSLSGKDFSCEDVFAAAKAGDRTASRVLQQVYGYLGQLLATLSCVTDPEVIVLGGGVSNAGQPLLEGVREAYRARCFDPTRETRIALAVLGNDAGIYGAFHYLLGG